MLSSGVSRAIRRSHYEEMRSFRKVAHVRLSAGTRSHALRNASFINFLTLVSPMAPGETPLGTGPFLDVVDLEEFRIQKSDQYQKCKVGQCMGGVEEWMPTVSSGLKECCVPGIPAE